MIIVDKLICIIGMVASSGMFIAFMQGIYNVLQF